MGDKEDDGNYVATSRTYKYVYIWVEGLLWAFLFLYFYFSTYIWANLASA